jgi:putative phosphoesterase
MKIGILSDTHGHLSSVGKSAKVFRASKVGAIFHCGDIGSLDVLAKLAVLGVPVHAVLGNVDLFSDDWKYAPTPPNVRMHGRMGEIELAGKQIALMHGDDTIRLQRIVASEKYDIVLSGHTHVFSDHAEGGTRSINPGTAGRGSPNKCIVLDLVTGDLKLFDL